ncbi:Methyl-accepting chemotaxis protein (MCP) signalling domain-containing protein [Thermanaeromonas toyohensis ToBE]|uniref:Methyl-accepting chemotaxis protein (MCP) signalling domain-containing protein n=1 Tax=Thermanaeromonas toyohensis ToBE TaxID=698762 RepID=A0A1W1VYR7_9FIRM|nr:methyl-accepting chemotaxis protein [Thermanaeromonas toyohensis]SMB98507.1 Methyl-accepting chemotaxis protein (MCP) signalling domain-containing protein [Thermanaeromonas toyohensis ToBE]
MGRILSRSPEAGFSQGQTAVSEEAPAGPVQPREPASHPETETSPQNSEAPGLSQLLEIIELQIGSLVSESEKVFSSILHSIDKLQERVFKSLTNAQELGRKIYSSASEDNGGIVGRTIRELVSFSHEAETALQQVVNRLTISRDNCRSIAEKAEKELYGFVEEVSSIAYKTKILALNASILAAHAGQHGRGFEVVAREVRRLADMAYEATLRVKRIAEDIAGSVKEVSLELQDYLDEIEGEKQQIDNTIKKASQDINSAAHEVEGLISNLLSEIEGFFQDIDSTIVAGQFQDIARQRLQHILEVLRELGDILRVDLGAFDVLSRGKLEKTIVGMVEKYTTHIERQNHYAALGMKYEESLGDNVELF